ncbi:MAG: hypothetical protein EBU90_20385 [Proteobacteria bacterium]|nr:hypothetical protein [Pseudomonadota bacterium]
MNDKIIELFYMQVADELCHGREWCVSGVDDPLRRFAELIVRECIAQVRKDENGPAYEAAGRIWEYFGDEE